ncbi:MAG: metallophosphoesterase [Mesorhizobium sp.]|uniref:metallophosphoesterase family protein n=1 Tax=Mesorhizobium sp. TaxID=1871066 RepID=UPI001ACC78E6|nr:metallophosphoesterase [Mesorhizobium sp.]MBN9218538.1 metallophosphoesterase [Mesorhizobium sp.]
MKTIAHLSDLHFGRIDQIVSDALAAEVRASDPDIVVVSGDMTQRARKEEFAQARAFLDTLPCPQLVVPGNHDVPLYNLFARALTPLSRYKRYITADTDPFYADPELAIAGINTARSLTIKGGRINSEQLTWVRRSFADQPDETTRIVVTHHPFEGASANDDDGIVGRARMAMGVFSQSRVDVILSGHLHLNRMGSSAVRYNIEGYSALLIQAGTAISLRRRQEANSFNLIRIERPEIHLECRAWDLDEVRFVRATSKSFRLGRSGWAPTGGTTIPTLVQNADDEIVRADDRIHG